MKPIKLEEGKFYRSRDKGRVYGPMRKLSFEELMEIDVNSPTEYNWTDNPFGTKLPRRWTEWGAWTAAQSVMDLVEEVPMFKPEPPPRFFAAVRDESYRYLEGPFTTEEEAKKALTASLSGGYVGIVLKQVGEDYGIHVKTHTTRKLVPFADAGSVRTQGPDSE